MYLYYFSGFCNLLASCNGEQLKGRQKATGLKKVQPLGSFGLSGELSKNKKSKILGERAQTVLI